MNQRKKEILKFIFAVMSISAIAVPIFSFAMIKETNESSNYKEINSSSYHYNSLIQNENNIANDDQLNQQIKQDIKTIMRSKEIFGSILTIELYNNGIYKYKHNQLKDINLKSIKKISNKICTNYKIYSNSQYANNIFNTSLLIKRLSFDSYAYSFDPIFIIILILCFILIFLLSVSTKYPRSEGHKISFSWLFAI